MLVEECDGLDMETLDITNAEKAGFTVAQDWNAVQHLIDWQIGSGFERLSQKMMDASSAVGLLSMPAFITENLLNGGRAVQRTWILANKLGLAFQPQMSPPFFFARLLRGNGEGFLGFMKDRLTMLRKPYSDIWGINDNIAEVFMFRIFKGHKAIKRSYRLPVDEILKINE